MTTGFKKALAVIGAFILCLLTAALGLLALPVYAVAATGRAMRLAIAFDQVANVLLGGQPDEMISAKAYRIREKRRWPMLAIDWLFFNIAGEADHCRSAFEKERGRAHLPKGY